MEQIIFDKAYLLEAKAKILEYIDSINSMFDFCNCFNFIFRRVCIFKYSRLCWWLYVKFDKIWFHKLLYFKFWQVNIACTFKTCYITSNKLDYLAWLILFGINFICKNRCICRCFIVLFTYFVCITQTYHILWLETSIFDS